MSGLHKVEFIVTNEEGKQTAWFGLGEMDLVDVLDLECTLLPVLLEMAKANKVKLPK